MDRVLLQINYFILSMNIGSWVGDGWPDCLDGSDENQDNKQSLPEQLVCDCSIIMYFDFTKKKILNFSVKSKFDIAF